MRDGRLMLILVLSALGLWMVGCGGSDVAVPTTGRLEGTVYQSADGTRLSITRDGSQPVSGSAHIQVQGTALQITTSSSGYFSIDGIPAGARRVLISRQGLPTLLVDFVIHPGATTPLANGQITLLTRQWTVLVFLNADNDLETFGVQDVNEMERVPDSDEVTIAVQMDRTPGWDTTNDNWTGTRRLQIRHDDDPLLITSPVLEDLGEVDMGQPEALRDFIAWGQGRYPAAHYLLVMWNHGSGWRSRALTGMTTRGVSFDDSSGTFIKTVDLGAALTSSAPVDMVAFDASLMQMLEIAYQIRQTCSYVVGSEESPPGAGYAYHTWLGPLVNNPHLSAQALGETMARETLGYYGATSNITHSVLATAELPGLVQTLDALAGRLIATGNRYQGEIATARETAEHYAYLEYKDLAHYCDLLNAQVEDPGVRQAVGDVKAALGRAVVANYHGTEHPNSAGVSIFLPTPTAYARLASLYTPLALSQATRWDDWLAQQPQ